MRALLRNVSRKQTVTLTGVLFVVFCLASLVLLYRLFNNPDTTYTSVEVRDAGPFQPREEEEAERKVNPEAKPVSSLEFIPRRQVPLSPPYDPSAEAELPVPPPAQPAPEPPQQFVTQQPPKRQSAPLVVPRFMPMPESKTASGASSSAFLAAPKSSGGGARTEPAASGGSRSAAPAKSAPKSQGREFTTVIR